ncbi:MAG TPA: hypothetical protein DEP84_28955, partial [Chloroflexi bacterium]|nr:hypothetical protein [Chloroflexota bacterium]
MEGQKEGMPRLLLLADDLTGALDCSVQFVGRATTVGVAVRPGVCVEANVVAVDTRTRDAPGAAVRAPLV